MEIKQLLILLFHLCEQSGEIKDQEVLAQDLSEESESSRERKPKRRKKKSRHKKSRSKKSRKKHRRNDSFSESEDDRSHSEDTTKANVGNATTDSRKCSLDELATIATAITFQNNGGES